MKDRRPISWISGQGGIEGRINPWAQNGDPDFLIESDVSDEKGRLEVTFLLRYGEDYVYRHLVDPLVDMFGSDPYEEYRYSLRGAMRMAERFRYGQECSLYQEAHRLRAGFTSLFGIERLREQGFKLWLRNHYGSMKYERGGRPDARLDRLEQLVEGEVLRRYREGSADDDSPT